MSTLTPPTIEAIEHAAKEGLEAARQGRHFSDACPYTFSQFHGIEQVDFDVTKRPLLEAWFSAWMRASHQQPHPPRHQGGNMTQEREAFEAWALGHGLDLAWTGQQYSDCNADYAWTAWQARASLAQPASVPAGWRLVPVEPTPEMLAALWAYRSDSLKDCYCAMLAAAPVAPQPQSMRCSGCDLINGCPEYCLCTPAVQAPAEGDGWPCPKCGVERSHFPACAQEGCPLMLNGLAEAETNETASVKGLIGQPQPKGPGDLKLNDPAVQRRLAAQWGYVQAPAPAQPKETPAGDLLPCPFCGGDVDIACVELMSSRDGGPVYVHCDVCGADGPQHDWADDAKADWNRRTQSTTAVEAAPQPEAQPTNRCEFEVHAAERGFELERYPQGPYVSFNTDKHWETWRAALAAPSAQAEPAKCPHTGQCHPGFCPCSDAKQAEQKGGE